MSDTEKELILITDAFPYGPGEKSFVGPEVEYLSKSWNITIVSFASKKERFNEELETPLPEGVKCVWCGSRSWLKVFCGYVKMVFTKEGRSEIRRVISEGPKRVANILMSVAYYGLTWDFLCNMEASGIFNTASDKVFYSYWFSHGAMALSIARKSHKINFVSRIHRYDLYNESPRFDRQPFQWFKRDNCERLLFVADYAKEYFEETYGLLKTDGGTLQTDVCRLGAFPPDEVPNNAETGAKRLIVSCSYCISRKRVHLIVEALSTIDDIDYEWVHFGDGSERENLEALARDKGVKANFVGAISNSEIQDFYRRNYVDLFVTTSASEGCPVSLMEASAFGIPIVATNVGGISEIVEENGILLNADPSPEEIADAIRAVLKADDDATRKMRMRSREIFMNKFNLMNNLERLDTILDEHHRR